VEEAGVPYMDLWGAFGERIEEGNRVIADSLYRTGLL
jgi:hypothetical protein